MDTPAKHEFDIEKTWWWIALWRTWPLLIINGLWTLTVGAVANPPDLQSFSTEALIWLWIGGLSISTAYVAIVSINQQRAGHVPSGGRLQYYVAAAIGIGLLGTVPNFHGFPQGWLIAATAEYIAATVLFMWIIGTS